MRNILLVFAFSVMSYFVNGQCFPDGLTITSQDQIDDFATDYPDCTEIGSYFFITNVNNLRGLSQLKKVNHLKIYAEDLISLEGLDSLEEATIIEIEDCGLFSIDFPKLMNLEQLKIQNNSNLEHIGFDKLDTCFSIYIGNNSSLIELRTFSNINECFGLFIEANEKLKIVEIDGVFNNLRTLGLLANQNLDTINLKNITSVNENFGIIGVKDLKSLDIRSLSSVGLLGIDDIGGLESLEMYSNLTNVTGRIIIVRMKNLKKLTGLEKISKAFSLKLSNNPNLISLDGLNENLKLDMGLAVTDNPKLVDCEQLCFLSVDVPDVIVGNNGVGCSELDVTNCNNVVSGRVFYDENKNGIFDNSELSMENIEIDVTHFNNAFLTNEIGQYYFPFYKSDEEYIITLNEYSTFELTTGNDSYTVTAENVIDETNFDFGLIHDGDYHDIISNISSFAPRCNEEVEFKLKLTNLGSYVENGKVIIRYDGYNNFTGKASPQPNQIDTSKHLLYYNYENFRPFEIKEYRFSLKMPGVEAIDQFISNSGVIYNVVDGDTSLISHCNLREIIQCSFDPNDKTAYPQGVQDENYTLKSDTLRYRIRFQNTGNAEAYDITVRDTLSEYLDMSTFKILASSHPVQTSIARSTSREIAFVFEDIHLPDSTSNPEGSQGYVMYEILPKKDLPENTVIENTAFIYFDYNPAIVTNTAFNTMVTTIPVEEDPGDDKPEDEDPEIEKPIVEKMIITPNPTNTFFKLSLESDLNLEVVLTDITGKITKKMKYEKDKSYSIREILAGLYFVNVVDLDSDEVIFMEKLVILK